MLPKYLHNNKIQTISLFILILIFTILSFQTFGRAFREGGYDFTSYLLSSETFWNGGNPYLTQSPYPYIYPLFLAVVLIPFVYLTRVISDTLFLMTNMLLLFNSYFLIIKYFFDKKLQLSALILPSLVLTIFLLEIIQNNLLNGQINITVLFFTILFLIFYLKEKPIAASLFLSIGISIKLTPLIFLFFLLKRKEYKLIVTTILFSLLFTFGIPYLIQGDNSIDAYKVYFQKLNELSFAEALKEKNKIFTLNDFITFLIPALKGNTLIKIFSSVIVILTLFLLDKGKSISKQKEILIFSIYSAAILLITPMSESHHIIVILPALSAIIYLLFFNYSPFRKEEIFILILFIISFLLSTILKFAVFYFLAFVLLISLTFSVYRKNYE